MEDCIFCKIAEEKVPAEVIYRDEQFVVFKDINPKAPIHLLFIPKKHIVSVNHIKEDERVLIGELFLLAQKIAKEQKIADKGYKKAAQENPEIARGINIIKGKVTHKGVAEAFDLEYESVDSML